MNKITAFLMSTVALVAGIEIASAGTKHPAATSSGSDRYAHILVHKSKSHVIYDQNDSDSGNGIVSQNFESSFDQYDSQAADDFTVLSGQKWIVKEVDVTGVYFNGSGPAVSENVFFYKNKGGLPDKFIAKYTVVGTDSFGSFAIALPGKGQKFKPGTYWVSVQVNMDFSSGGEWGWEKRTTVTGFPAAWQNPGDGFGTGCTTWGVEDTCLGLPKAPPGQPGGLDHMFSLRGKIKGG